MTAHISPQNPFLQHRHIAQQNMMVGAVQHLRALASEYGQVHPFCTRFAIDNGSCFFAATCNIIMRKVINLGFAQLKWISTVDITSEIVKKLRND